MIKNKIVVGFMAALASAAIRYMFYMFVQKKAVDRKHGREHLVCG